MISATTIEPTFWSFRQVACQLVREANEGKIILLPNKLVTIWENRRYRVTLWRRRDERLVLTFWISKMQGIHLPLALWGMDTHHVSGRKGIWKMTASNMAFKTWAHKSRNAIQGAR